MPPYENFVAANLHVVEFQGARRRAGDVPAIQVIHAVVACAPDFVQIVAILHGARKMGTGGGHRPVVTAGSANEQSGPAAKTKNLAAIGLQFTHATGDDTNVERDYIIADLSKTGVIAEVTSYQARQQLHTERVNHYITDGQVTAATLTVDA